MYMGKEYEREAVGAMCRRCVGWEYLQISSQLSRLSLP